MQIQVVGFIEAQAYRRSLLPQLFTERDETFMTSTIPTGTDTGWGIR